MTQPSDLMLARPTSAAFAGKQTATLKCSVTDEVEFAFKQMAAARGYGSSSDFLREVVIVTVYGPDVLSDLHRQRIQALVQNWPTAEAQA